MPDNSNRNMIMFVVLAGLILVLYQVFVIGPQQKRQEAVQAAAAAQAKSAPQALNAPGAPGATPETRSSPLVVQFQLRPDPLAH